MRPSLLANLSRSLARMRSLSAKTLYKILHTIELGKALAARSNKIMGAVYGLGLSSIGLRKWIIISPKLELRLQQRTLQRLRLRPPNQ